MRNNLEKHKSNTSRFSMVKHLHHMVLGATKVVVNSSSYVGLSYHGVTTWDNQSWANVHVYVVWDWKKILILFSLECSWWCKCKQYDSIDHWGINNWSALSKKDMTKKLISFRVNGIIVFQGIYNGVKMQIQEKYALHKHGNANSKPFIFNFKVKKSTTTIVCIFHS